MRSAKLMESARFKDIAFFRDKIRDRLQIVPHLILNLFVVLGFPSSRARNLVAFPSAAAGPTVPLQQIRESI
jgi:hypothetical protein